MVAVGAGSDKVDYSDTTASVTVNLATGNVTSSEAGNDTVSNIENVDTGAGDDVIIGNSGANVIQAGDGDDNVVSGAGDDTISGGAGDDALSGGSGDDAISGGAGEDTISGGAGDDTLDGGADADTLSFAGESSGVDIDLTDGTAVGTGSGSDTISNFENVMGGAGRDTIKGDAGDNILAGGAGDDTYTVTDGDDTIITGTGSDTLEISHGYSIDQIELVDEDLVLSLTKTADNSSHSITVQNHAASPLSALRVYSSSTDYDDYSLLIDYNADTDTYTARIDGLATRMDGTSGGETLVGKSGNDLIFGNAGDDIIDGGEGDDQLFGGLGDDVYRVASGDDEITVGGGDDQLILSGQLKAATVTGSDLEFEANFGGEDYSATVLGHTSETLKSVGFDYDGDGTVDQEFALTDSLDGSANADDTLIVGTSSGEALSGGAASDVLLGNAGADTLFGGAGDDQLYGGAGNDAYLTSLGDDTIHVGGGDDTLKVTGSMTEVSLKDTDGEGVANDLVFQINDGTNDLTVTVSDHVGDPLKYVDIDPTDGEVEYIVGETLIVGSDEADTLQSSDAGGVIFGNLGNDQLSGGTGDDQLVGGGGRDTLEGGAGDDKFVGGDGVDTASFAGASQLVSADLEAGVASGAGTGTDTFDGVENLLGGSGDDTLSGDDGSNVISGGAGNDTLTGRGGSDTLVGGDGVDTVSFDGETSSLTVNLDTGVAVSEGTGSDTITSVENVVAGSGNDFLTGDASDNTLVGGDGDDALSGGLGDDHLVGGAGDDTYTVDSGDDTIVVGGGADSLVMGGRMTGAIRTDDDGDGNFDLELTGVSDGEVYTATVLDQTNDGLTNVELDLSDDGVDNATSYSIDDTLIIGTDGADTLVSGDDGGAFFANAGNDQMTGGDGADLLAGGLGNDTIEGKGGDDVIDGGDGIDHAMFVEGTAGIAPVSQVTSLALGDDFAPVPGDTVTLSVSSDGREASITYTVTTGDMADAGIDPDTLAANIRAQFHSEFPALSDSPPPTVAPPRGPPLPPMARSHVPTPIRPSPSQQR